MADQSPSTSFEKIAEKAISMHQNGRLEEARALYDKALAQSPDSAEILYYSGVLAAQTGKYEQALEYLARAEAGASHVADIPYNIGVVQKELGRYNEAAEAYRRAVRINADFPDAYNNLGYVLQCLNQLNDAADAYRRALDLDPNYVAVRTNLALLLKQCGDLEGAAQEFKKALELDPGNESLQQDLQDTYRKMVPPWHFPMLNDHARNEAYSKAISSTVTPDDIVLDIGTGSGLLAMMAAQAGAKHVYACEVIKSVADTARRIVAENGFSDKITVIDKSSTELEIGRDLPEPASYLVSEILDIVLLGEGVLPSLRHANNCLLTPDATVIPDRADAWGLLVNCENFKKINTVGRVHGFDLHLFNYFHQTSHGFDLERDEHLALTEPFKIFTIDFKKLPEDNREFAFELPILSDGTAQAVVAWFDLTLFDDIVFSTRKGERHNHWRQVIFFLEKERKVKKGEFFSLTAGHTAKNLFFKVPE